MLGMDEGDALVQHERMLRIVGQREDVHVLPARRLIQQSDRLVIRAVRRVEHEVIPMLVRPARAGIRRARGDGASAHPMFLPAAPADADARY